MKRKYYLSGKISGLSVEDYTHNFEVAKNQIFYRYHPFCSIAIIINPLDIKPFLGLKFWLCYMISDIMAQRKCTHSAFQKNWTNSKGAVIEYFFAKFIFNNQIIFL